MLNFPFICAERVCNFFNNIKIFVTECLFYENHLSRFISIGLQGVNMKNNFRSILVLITSVSFSAQAISKNISHKKVIYGEDNRKEVSETNNPQYVELAKSTAAMINKKDLKMSGDKTQIHFQTLKDKMGVCENEKFSYQISLANCSGFLIGPDLLVTAGHCMAGEGPCRHYSWVFDFNKDEAFDTKIESSNVYNCKKVINHKLEAKKDYALIKLDREVEGRKNLKFRKKGGPSVGDELVVIGHPSGLPTKIADGAKVVKSDNKDFFVSDLDTFGGNSGSAVFNAKNGLIEGILVRGARDYKFNTTKGCYEVNKCARAFPDFPFCGGEDVSKITRVFDYLKPIFNPINFKNYDGKNLSFQLSGELDNLPIKNVQLKINRYPTSWFAINIFEDDIIPSNFQTQSSREKTTLKINLSPYNISLKDQLHYEIELEVQFSDPDNVTSIFEPSKESAKNIFKDKMIIEL